MLANVKSHYLMIWKRLIELIGLALESSPLPCGWLHVATHVLLIVTKWCVHACTECMRQRRNVLPASWGNKGKSLNARKNSFINFWSGVSNSKTALDISHPYSSTRCFFIRTIASQIKHRLDWVGKTAAEINGDNCGERVLFFFKQ